MPTPNQLPLDPQAYHAALASLHLRGVLLRDLKATCHNPVAGGAQIKISPAADGEFKDGELRINAEYKIAAHNEKRPLFDIEVTFCVVMTSPDELPDGFLDIYVANNLNLTVFPYVREIVASLTSRMGLPPLTLPYIVNPYAPDEKPPKRRAARKKTEA